MGRRIWINLAVFAALFLVLAWWDLNNVLRIDAIKRPYHASAEFATSPGLRSGFAVTYLGVTVGHLGAVHVVGTHVKVDLKLNHGVSLPAQLDAKVRRKSAVGEPYVDLTPTGGVDPGGPRLRAGTNIPLARTSTPLEYSEVFDTIGRLVDALPIDDVNRLLHSVAQGVDGRIDDFRSIIGSTTQLTTTLANNAPLLDQLAGDLTQLTHTLAEHRGAIGTGFDNLAALAQTIDSQKVHLAALLDKTPAFVGQVQQLLDTSGSDIGCLFEEGANLWTAIDTPELVTSFARLVSLAPATAKILNGIPYQGPDGMYLNGSVILSLSNDNPRIYNPPLQMPPLPAVQWCAAPTRGGSAGTEQGTANGGTTPAGPGEHAVTTPGIPGGTVPGHEASSDHKTKGTDFGRYVLPGVMLGLLLLLGALVSTRPWRFLATLLRRGGDGDAS